MSNCIRSGSLLQGSSLCASVSYKGLICSDEPTKKDRLTLLASALQKI